MKSRQKKHVLPFGDEETFRLQSHTTTASTILETPGQLLRLARTRLRMTQAQLGVRAGIDAAHITRIETGQIDAQWNTLVKLFRALQCDLVPYVRPQPSFEAIEEAQIKDYAAAWTKRSRASDSEPMSTKKALEWEQDMQKDLRKHRTTEIWD
jgi:transcriptional regulator with XRE-family HTH domain